MTSQRETMLLIMLKVVQEVNAPGVNCLKSLYNRLERVLETNMEILQRQIDNYETIQVAESVGVKLDDIPKNQHEEMLSYLKSFSDKEIKQFDKLTSLGMSVDKAFEKILKERGKP
jgi:hypothetical protein